MSQLSSSKQDIEANLRRKQPWSWLGLNVFILFVGYGKGDD